MNRHPENPPAVLFAVNPDADLETVIQLETPCGRCHTQGYVETAPWRAYRDAWAVWGGNNRPQVEIDAWQRDNPLPDVDDVESCPECAGSGWLLTPAGRTLMAFLARHKR